MHEAHMCMRRCEATLHPALIIAPGKRPVNMQSWRTIQYKPGLLCRATKHPRCTAQTASMHAFGTAVRQRASTTHTTTNETMRVQQDYGHACLPERYG